MADELLVYDTRTHRAHCLNRTSALVFRLANGRRSIDEIAGALETSTGVDLDQGVVRAALDTLDEAGLLESSTPPLEQGPESSRREVLGQLGLGAALLAPAVVSLLVPAPAEAAATCIRSTTCTTVNIGQPCYVANPSLECQVKTCSDTDSCT
jgi:hypothetical protein